MKIRTTQLTVTPDTTFNENAYVVEIDDEATGEYVTVSELRTGQKVAINPEDWPMLREAIDKLIQECAKE